MKPTNTHEKDLLQDVAEDQREQMLTEMAKTSTFEKVKRHYSEDEKSQIREFVSNESIVLMDKQEEFKAIKKEFDAAIKEAKNTVTSSLKDLKKGYSENDEKVYMIDDQENGIMNVYDNKGKFLYSRKLFADERQTTILEMASQKTGTHDE